MWNFFSFTVIANQCNAKTFVNLLFLLVVFQTANETHMNMLFEAGQQECEVKLQSKTKIQI